LESIPTSLWSVGDAAPTRATSLEVDDEGVTFRTVEEVADYLIGADYVSRRAVRDAKRAES
jgi:hypothetical protein